MIGFTANIDKIRTVASFVFVVVIFRLMNDSLSSPFCQVAKRN